MLLGRRSVNFYTSILRLNYEKDLSGLLIPAVIGLHVYIYKEEVDRNCNSYSHTSKFYGSVWSYLLKTLKIDLHY